MDQKPLLAPSQPSRQLADHAVIKLFGPTQHGFERLRTILMQSLVVPAMPEIQRVTGASETWGALSRAGEAPFQETVDTAAELAAKYAHETKTPTVKAA